MATVYLAPTFGAGYQGFTTGGLPLNAGLIYTYIAGGTTPQATFTTSAGTVQNANPIVLNADGRTPAEVWLSPGVSYRFDVKDSLGNLIQTYDNLYGINDSSAPVSATFTEAALGIVQVTSVGGTANAITGATPASFSAYAARQLFLIIPSGTNTGATSIILTPSGASALPSRNIFSDGAACVGGEIKANVPIILEDDGTQLNIVGRRFFKQPTRTVLTSGSAATYTTPSGATRLNVRMVGGGGGGSGATANNGNNGSASTFAGGSVTLSAGGGGGGTALTNGGGGGSTSGGDINMTGAPGQGSSASGTAGVGSPGGMGGNSVFGGAGGTTGYNQGTGQSAATNSGSGGQGGAAGSGTSSGAGGGSGGYCEKLITSPATTYTYTVGAKGTGGTAGGSQGGDGAAGIIIVDEYYN